MLSPRGPIILRVVHNGVPLPYNNGLQVIRFLSVRGLAFIILTTQKVVCFKIRGLTVGYTRQPGHPIAFVDFGCTYKVLLARNGCRIGIRARAVTTRG